VPAAVPNPLAVLHALGVAGVTAAEPALGGFDTAVWRVTAGGRGYALRLFHPWQEDRCRRETTIMSAAADRGAPVPRIHAEGRWEGRPALLMDWCPGRPLLAELIDRPERAHHLGSLFGAMQARIHAVPAPRGLGAEPWIDAAGPGGGDLRRRLGELHPRTDALLHLDYHFLNVLTDGARITGVIDWANARPGDPRADLARTMTILRLDVPSHLDLVPPRVAAVLPLFDLGWRSGYARAAGPGAVVDMPAFYAWAGAAMARDLAGRRSEAFFARVRAWTVRWSARAGCAAP